MFSVVLNLMYFLVIADMVPPEYSELQTCLQKQDNQ